MKSRNRIMSAIIGLAASLPFGAKRTQQQTSTTPTLGGCRAPIFGKPPFNAFWLFLKGAPSRTVPGQSNIPQWSWPDKDRYGQAADGSIRRRTPKTPYRVRRWRKRAAARISKAQGHTLEYARVMVRNIELGVVRDIVDTKKVAARH